MLISDKQFSRADCAQSVFVKVIYHIEFIYLHRGSGTSSKNKKTNSTGRWAILEETRETVHVWFLGRVQDRLSRLSNILDSEP